MKNLIIELFRSAGFQINKYPGGDLKRRLQIINYTQIDKILDVGANIGQYAILMRKLGFKGKIVSFESMVADSSAQRAQGFQHICESVIDSTQILFVYSRPIKAQFHMMNVKAPLDIGFFDSAGKLVGLMVMNTYDDGNRRLYSPNQEFQYALEGHVGFFSDFGMSTGKTRLVINSIFDES